MNVKSGQVSAEIVESEWTQSLNSPTESLREIVHCLKSFDIWIFQNNQQFRQIINRTRLLAVRPQLPSQLTQWTSNWTWFAQLDLLSWIFRFCFEHANTGGLKTLTLACTWHHLTKLGWVKPVKILWFQYFFPLLHRASIQPKHQSTHSQSKLLRAWKLQFQGEIEIFRFSQVEDGWRVSCGFPVSSPRSSRRFRSLKCRKGRSLSRLPCQGSALHRLFPKQGKLLQSQLRTGKAVIKINGSACIRRVQQSLTGIDAGIQDLW